MRIEISNTPLAMLSLRPGDTSMVPRPSVIVAVPPVTRILTSASRMAGKPSTGRTEMPLVSTSTCSASSDMGGPRELSIGVGAFMAITMRSIRPPDSRYSLHSRTRGATNTGQMRNAQIDRHARAGKAERNAGLRPGVIEEAGHGDAEIVLRTRIDAPEVELFEIEPPLVDIEVWRTDTARLSDSGSGPPAATVPRSHRIDHRRAVDVEMPDPRLPRLGLDLRHHGDLVIAGDDPERHDEGAAFRIPGKAQGHAVDVDPRRRLLVEVGDVAGLRKDVAFRNLRRPSAAISPRMLMESSRSASKVPSPSRSASSTSLGRRFVRVERDDAVIVGSRRHRGTDLPGTFSALRPKREFDTAGGRPGQAEVIRENVQRLPLRRSSTIRLPPFRPRIATDRNRRTAGPESVDPGQQRRQFLIAGTLRRGRRRRRCEMVSSESLRRRMAVSPLLSRCFSWPGAAAPARWRSAASRRRRTP